VLTLNGETFSSRLFLGSSRYPSPAVLSRSIGESGTQIVTVSLRRQSPENRGGAEFWNTLQSTGVRVLPNTAGCFSVKEAVNTAHMAREFFKTNWIKLEVIGDEFSLQPNPFLLCEAAKVLIQDGFFVLPYMTDDVVVAKKLVSLGCQVLMPWGAPIGTGQGILNPHNLLRLRAMFPQVALIVDAGLGAPSHAALAMELGCDGVMLNTAVAISHDPVRMARAFAKAVEAGREAYESGLMPPSLQARASTPQVGIPFV
jgi:thiazole synthase